MKTRLPHGTIGWQLASTCLGRVMPTKCQGPQSWHPSANQRLHHQSPQSKEIHCWQGILTTGPMDHNQGISWHPHDSHKDISFDHIFGTEFETLLLWRKGHGSTRNTTPLCLGGCYLEMIPRRPYPQLAMIKRTSSQLLTVTTTIWRNIGNCENHVKVTGPSMKSDFVKTFLKNSKPIKFHLRAWLTSICWSSKCSHQLLTSHRPLAPLWSFGGECLAMSKSMDHHSIMGPKGLDTSEKHRRKLVSATVQHLRSQLLHRLKRRAEGEPRYAEVQRISHCHDAMHRDAPGLRQFCRLHRSRSFWWDSTPAPIGLHYTSLA